MLQQLPKQFHIEFVDYLQSKKEMSPSETDLFMDSTLKAKKQFENSLALFKELILRRKKKLLNLVFVAAETGILKRDFENMLPFEQSLFEKLVKAFEEGEKELAQLLQGKRDRIQNNFSMILFTQNTEQFIDMAGNAVGLFNAGQLANLEKEVSQILVSSGKASYVDE
jgi:hypothetical protein